MDECTAQPTLVVIAGPIAAGKSTVARELRDELHRHAERVALVELDQIAEMALPTLPSWPAAHAIFTSVVGQWLQTGLTCVIAEGSGNPDEVRDLVDLAPPSTPVVRVVLTSPFEVSFARALTDPTRGISRDREFLAGVYRTWALDLPRMPSDVFVDTSETSVEETVAAIRAALDRARR